MGYEHYVNDKEVSFSLQEWASIRALLEPMLKRHEECGVLEDLTFDDTVLRFTVYETFEYYRDFRSLPKAQQDQLRIMGTKTRPGDAGDLALCTCLVVLAAHALDRGEDPQIASDGASCEFEVELCNSWDKAFEQANKLLGSAKSRARPFDMATDWWSRESFLGHRYQRRAQHDEAKAHTAELEDALGSLFDDPSVSNVVFSVGGQEVHAIKQVVCRRSGAFRKMLGSGAGGTAAGSKRKREEQQGKTVVVVSDCEPGPFRRVLGYLHCTKCPIGVEDVCETLVAADRFEVEALREECMRFFFDHKEAVMRTAGYKRLQEGSKDLLIVLLERAMEKEADV